MLKIRNLDKLYLVGRISIDAHLVTTIKIVCDKYTCIF